MVVDKATKAAYSRQYFQNNKESIKARSKLLELVQKLDHLIYGCILRLVSYCHGTSDYKQPVKQDSSHYVVGTNCLVLVCFQQRKEYAYETNRTVPIPATAIHSIPLNSIPMPKNTPIIDTINPTT